MRQGQQNRRGRGRNNNNNANRKGQNPLTRSFESNGPDVKIRGTPAHVAEKYMSLARDALSSGDPVLAENYLQHAEHYNRIIMAYREQQTVQSGDGANNAQQRQRNHHNGAEPSDGHDAVGASAEGESQNDDAGSQPPGSEPQPAVGDFEVSAPASEGGSTHGSGRTGNRRGRGNGGDRGGRERSSAANGNGDASPRSRSSSSGDRSRFGDSGDQPDFLRRPVRRPRRAAANADDQTSDAAIATEASPVEENQD